MKTKKIFIEGMHCVSCEKLLDSEFRNIEGIKDVKVDRKKNDADIIYEGEDLDTKEIRKIAEKFGYKVNFDENSKNNNRNKAKASIKDWAIALVITLTILFIYRIFQNIGLPKWANIDTSKLNYGISFLVGLTASVSSCLVVVGGVVIAFGEKYSSQGKSFFQRSLKPNLLFQAGRLATFFILGGLLGLIGGEISISGGFISIFTIVISIVMLWLGLDILGVLPSISNLGIKMPSRLTKNWDSLKKSEHALAPFALGGLSFFLPCGFTQSMQIFALASGSFWVGGLSLLFFALGTLPSLLALGTFASWTKNKKIFVFQKVAGFLIIIFAVYTFQSGLVLLGVKNNILNSKDVSQALIKPESPSNSSQTSSKKEQVVKTKITNLGFEPNLIKIKEGVPVKFIINGDNATGCTNKVIIPEYNISQAIKKGDNIIRFTPTSKGYIDFSCWMGMVRGKFKVE